MTFLIQQTLTYAVPLMIVALAGVFAERSGIINLALEGIMIFGAFIGVLFVNLTQKADVFAEAKAAGDWVALQGFMVLAMAVAALMGAVFSLLLSFASVNLKADQTIGGTALNLLAPALVLFFIRIIANQNTLQMAEGDSASWFMIKKSFFGYGRGDEMGFFGRTFIDICRGFGMRVLAYDKFPAKDSGLDYVELDTLLRESDVISLHCPLTPDTRHILNRDAFSRMKKGVFILNTSRGALIDSEALLDALNSRTVGGAGLDVYEEEANLFYEDRSDTIIHDDTLALLVSRPNVILTAHQAFLTEEALHNIAEETIKNLDAFFSGAPLENEICYLCDRDKAGHDCRKTRRERCF